MASCPEISRKIRGSSSDLRRNSPSEPALNAIPDLVKVTPQNSPKSYLAAAERVGKTPVWIFHGANDDIVPVTESRRMTEAMKQIGAEVRYTNIQASDIPAGTKPTTNQSYFHGFSRSPPGK